MGDRVTSMDQWLLGLAFFLTLLSSGCSVPKMVVLRDPLTPEEHLNLGLAYERKGEFELAIKEYHQASRKLPLAFLYLGNAYFSKNEWKEAEVFYRKAIQKDPQRADAYNNLAWLYYLKGENLDEAEALAQEALKLDPSKGLIYQDTLDKIREKRKSSR